MNRRILLQVTAPAILTGLLLVGACLGSAWSIHRLRANLGRVLSENVASLQAALDLEAKMRQVRYHALLYLIQPTPAELEEIQAAEEAFGEALHAASEAADTPAEQDVVARIAAGFASYRAEMARLRALVEKDGPRTDFAALARSHPIRHIIGPSQELGRLNREQLDQTVADSTATSEHARGALLLLGLGGPVGGLLCGYGLARALTRSLARLQVQVRAASDALDTLAAPPGPGQPGHRGARPDGEIDLAAFTVQAEGDLSALDRQLAHVLARVTEVTHRLQRQHAEMRRAEQLAAVGQLAAGVAHEVRNPLAGMKLLIEAALRPQRPQPLTDEDLGVILGEISRLERTVQHFLDFARPPAVQRSPADLREVVSRAADLVKARARQQKVEVRLELPDAPMTSSVDGGLITTVLVNLLLNALDVLPHGGVVTVTGARAPDAGAWRVAVCDSGPGVSPAVADRLFTPFASTRPTGTGLGLALSRAIAQEHGGTLHAEAEGPGACFVLSLPSGGVV